MEETDYDSAVAIVGMSGRFPGAVDVDELWARAGAGISGLREISDDELSRAGIGPGLRGDPSYVRVGGPVTGVDMFDAAAFGFSPHEAETMEPQHRLFLECSWEALERAGYSPMETSGSVGVFAGCAFPDYMIDNVFELASQPEEAQLFATGNERDSLTSLVSYKLGLRGPSLTVQTFCSTSLVAVHLACQSLLTYESDLALAGGAYLPLPQPAGYRYDASGILSPDGRVRSLDAAANGTVMGSGVGVVALKRMADAQADGDVIHAVILGSAVNNDGRARAGYAAPGIDGQAAVIESALAVAGVGSQSVGYVECHAVGTPMGDSIELAALSRVFGAGRETPCVLSSIKPSVGHLDRAAGVTGLIRAALSLRHETLPGTAGFQAPSPALAADRFTVLTENRPWPAGPEPRRAGVSSFGVGGTNAHVVVEQAPPLPPRPPSAGPQLLTLSAGSRTALAALTERLRQHLAANRQLNLADVAYTLAVSRGRFALRRAVVSRDLDDAVAALANPARWIDGETRRRDPQVRLVVADGIGEYWWPELSRAARRVLPGPGLPPAGLPPAGLPPAPAGLAPAGLAPAGLAPAGLGPAGLAADSPADRGGALAEVAGGLTRLGVRLSAADDVTATMEIVVAPGAGSVDDWLLSTVARLWQAGASIDWAALHRGTGRRVELPSYPFQRQRHWIEAEPYRRRSRRSTGPASDRDRDQWTYLPTWRQHPLPVAHLDAQLRAAGPWLVFAAGQAEALSRRLTLAGAEVVTVRPGDGFCQDEIGDFTVRPADREDLARLSRSLIVYPRTVLHGFSLAPVAGESRAQFDRAQGWGVRSALELVRAFAAAPDKPPAELILLTSGAVGVLGCDLDHPEHAALAGLAPSLAHEDPRLTVRHIDLGRDVDASFDADLDQVLAAAVCTERGPVAVRGGQAWLRWYESHPLAVPDPQAPVFRAADTVLITGGLKGAGLILARHLSSTYGCRLVLTTGTPLPPREQWQRSAGRDDPAAEQIRCVLELEGQGARVLASTADVADEAAMRAVVRDARAAFGGIDVAVHAASADPGTRTAPGDLDEYDALCQTGVHGLVVLESVLGEQAAGRRVVLSSTAAVVGGIGLGPRGAADAALAARAGLHRPQGPGRWLTIDWDTGGTDHQISPAEVADVFDRAVAAAGHLAHLVVSRVPVESRWARHDDVAAPGELSSGQGRRPRAALATPFVEPGTALERAVSELFAADLGLDAVGVDDNFFELGGRSMGAVRLAARVGVALTVALPVTALVMHPTVRLLSAEISALTDKDEQ